MKLTLTQDKDLKLAAMLPNVKLLADNFPFDAFGKLPHTRTSIVQLPEKDWHFLHETAIISYHGTLFASWYNCPVNELAGMTPIRGRRSTDHGRTWSDSEVLGQDDSGKLMYCPPVYGIDHDTLYLFMNTMVSPDHIHSLELYRYNESTGKFEHLWSRPIPFKLNTNVYRLANGKLMLCGRIGELDQFPTTPAVMISDSGAMDAPWRIVKLQKDGLLPDGMAIGHAETSAIVTSDKITVFCREDSHNVPLVYESTDLGESWSGPLAHDIPFSNSKIYSGTLSDGRNYVIGNLQPGRSRLAILFTAPNSMTFTTGGLIGDGYDQRLDISPQFSYPVAYEEDGKLYVIYTMEKRGSAIRGRGAALSVINLEALKHNEPPATTMTYEKAFDDAAFAVNLWPQKGMPGVATTTQEHEISPDNNVLKITDVSTPALYVFPATAAKKPSPCMVICPGGGYGMLSWNLEGTEIAEFLAGNGMTAAILKYRCPDNRTGAFQDAQRAIRVVRAHAAEWNVDPTRVGIMGFSAGGHLTVRTACKFAAASYQPVDAMDALSPRPDFAVPVYPAYLNQGQEVAPEFLPLQNLPPMLLIHNADDKSFVPGTRIFFKAAMEAGTDCCFRHFTKGGHGYGLRSSAPVKDWGRTMLLWFHEKLILP